MEMNVKEYLKFLGIKNKRLDMLGTADKELVYEKLWLRLKYIFTKDIEKELEYVLDQLFPKYQE